MIIYKITNIKNNKIYIGQTINSLETRFNRHKNDALNNIIDTHFARAIRYYGPESFVAEIIDTAESEDELTKKEKYWINYYNSINEGYNETDAEYKSGGNTYKNKTKEEMTLISQKLRESKLGEKNPNHTLVKCKNINTNEEYHFGSQSEMQKFFNETNHQFISRRCLKQIKCLYKNEWLIAFEEDDYSTDYTLKGQTKKKGSQIKVTNLITNEIVYYPSLRELERAKIDGLPSRKLLGEIIKGQKKQPKNFLIEKLK